MRSREKDFVLEAKVVLVDSLGLTLFARGTCD